MESAKFILCLCLFLLPLGYLPLSIAVGIRLYVGRTVLCAELLLQAGLWWGYFRPQHYRQRLARAPSPEPHRVRYALLGAGLFVLSLLPIFLIPVVLRHVK